MASRLKQLCWPLAVAVTIAASLTVAGSPRAMAQEQLAPGAPPAGAGNISRPVVVLTLGSINKLQQDVNYLSAAVGQPQAAGMFAMVGMFTQGVDTNLPIGVIVPLVNGAPEPAILIPTADAKMMLKRLEGQLGPADELGDGTLAVGVMGQVVYVKQNPKWAVVSRNKTLLAAIPADPSRLFTGMGNDYDLAFRLKMQLVPANVRAMLIGQMRQGFERAMQSGGQQGPDTSEYAEMSMQQLEMLIEETDELFFGFNTDITGKRVVFDTKFTAVEGSKFAAMYGGQQSIPSRFASVIRPDAAAYFHGAATLSPELIEQTRGSVESSISMVKNALDAPGNDMPPEVKEQIFEMIDRSVNLMVDSMSEGKSDGGAIVMAEAGKLQFVYGSFVSDGNEAAGIVKDLASKLENVPNGPTFQFDVASHGGVSMHLISVDIPPDAEEARAALGDSLRIHVGTAPKAMYLALGDDSVPLLKEMIDSGNSDSGGKRPISQGRVRMLPFLNYIKSIKSNAAIDAMIGALRQSDLDGVVNFAADVVPNGQRGRFSVGEGILQAVGAAIQASKPQPQGF